ncbi:MAG: hypothetical protein AAFV62_13480, partial [Pseudomonadota bacterium]
LLPGDLGGLLAAWPSERWIGAGIVLAACVAMLLATKGVGHDAETGRGAHVRGGRQGASPLLLGMAALGGLLVPSLAVDPVGLWQMAPSRGAAPLLGTLLGLTLAGVVVAPGLRESGARTLPHLFTRRWRSPIPRVLASLVLAGSAVLLLIAMGRGCSVLLRDLVFSAPNANALAAGGKGLALLPILGAVLAVFLGRAAGTLRLQSMAALTGGLAIVGGAIWVAVSLTGVPVPQAVALGLWNDVAIATGGGEQGMSALAIEAALTALTVALIIAVWPSVVTGVLASGGAKASGRTVLWAIALAGVVLTCLPFLAIADLYETVFATSAERDGMVSIAGAASYMAEGATPGSAWIRLLDRTDALRVFLPLLLGGVVLALTAVCAGALHAASASLAHDVYVPVLDAEASAGTRAIFARVFAVTLALAASIVVLAATPAALSAIGFFSAGAVLAGGLLVPVVLALHWHRFSALGAGLAISCGTLLATAAVALPFLKGEAAMLAVLQGFHTDLLALAITPLACLAALLGGVVGTAIRPNRDDEV